MDPHDAVGDAVQRGIVLRARERRGVALDADDEVPVVLARKGDGVAAGAGEEVDEDPGWPVGGVLVVVVVVVVMVVGEMGGDLARNGLGCHAEPGVVGQADAVIVEAEEVVALAPVSLVGGRC